MTDEKFFDELSSLINDAFDGVFGRKESTPELPKPAPKKEQPKTDSLYESIEDYTAKTGKRFRMTKEQKNLGMTRDEAFSLTFGDN